ncbi:hypothetical protein V2J09_012424 [Rumex salicifolius]
MPPRKKQKNSIASSSSSSLSNSKKQNLTSTTSVAASTPTKFGIQHFFNRHSSSQLSKLKPSSVTKSSDAASDSPDRKTFSGDAVGDANPVIEVDLDRVRSSKSTLQESLIVDVVDSFAGSVSLNPAPVRGVKPVAGSDADGNPIVRETESTPSEKLLADTVDCEIISPQLEKSMSKRRSKFSPGMLIKQSQDDGGDEITWKISPVNERFRSISKNLPEVVKALAEASRGVTSNLRRCSNDVEGSLRSGNAVQLLNRVSLSRGTPGEDSAVCNGQNDPIEVQCSGDCDLLSPFRTPPSLPYCHNKLSENGFQNNILQEAHGLRPQKKALLDLLDQVEDVISVEDSSPSGQADNHISTVADKTTDYKPISFQSDVTELRKQKQETFLVSSSPYFLVLEVTEKHNRANSSGTQISTKVLRLLNEHTGKEQSVHLCDGWFYSVIEPGDTVRVIGEFDEQGNCYVDQDNNLVIVNPRALISGTRVAASFSCSRRAVLDERLRSSEQSIPALTGTVLHQIFQAGLLMETPTRELLEEFSPTVLLKNIEALYACGVNEYDMQKKVMEAIPRMLNWIRLFRVAKDSPKPTIDFGPETGLLQVSISEVVDIEEMVWAPKYGLKGMIDASICVRTESSGKGPEEKILPLEFKTGKGTSAVEHSAQVILYTLLMSERYLEDIDSGLLYYLHTDQTQGHVARRSDLAGLIMRRNELAHDILKAFSSQQLPPMLRSPNICKGCRHVNVCTIYHKVNGGTADSSGLGELFDSLTDHLAASHITFLKHWDRLIDLEAKGMQFGKNLWPSNLWKDEYSSTCLPYLVLDRSDDLHLQKDKLFVYRFVRQDMSITGTQEHDSQSGVSLKDHMDCALRNGDRVILSVMSNHVAVASGFITDISGSYVSVSMSKRLRVPRSTRSSNLENLYGEVWRIDKDEGATSFSIMRSNLARLFVRDAHSAGLRKMIVDLEAPRFESGCVLSQDPAISYVWSERNLNDDQRRAIIKILSARDYALILGMPGTGKTSTMVYAVKALLMRGASILLTSYTNSAVDNLLVKLKAQGIDFVRIGRPGVVHSEVHEHCISAKDARSVEEIRRRLDEVKVIAVTCLGITSPLLVNKRFDVCIMDEAGQITLPVSLGPLMFASKFVLVGDHYQLPPLVQSAEARESGMGVSLFCRLSEAHPQAISALQNQYRMCAGIMDLSNALIYGDRLQCGSSDVKNSKLKLLNPGSMTVWLKEVLSEQKPVIFINTDTLPALETRDRKTVNNQLEAYIVAKIAGTLVDHGIGKEDIGIITPYNSQASLIGHLVQTLSVEVHTIDKYQGRDKDCILLSFVRSSRNSSNHSSSLLGDWHRINVALTRAKKKLIMVGSCTTLSRVPLLKLLIDKVHEQSGIVNVTKHDIEPDRSLRRCSQITT